MNTIYSMAEQFITGFHLHFIKSLKKQSYVEFHECC